MQFSSLKNYFCSVLIAFTACAVNTRAADITGQPSIDNAIPDFVLKGVIKSFSSPVTAAIRAPLSRQIFRSRPVALDIALLQKLRTDLIEAPQTIRIAFFDDAVLLVQISHTERVGRNGIAYIGAVPGIAMSSAVIVEENGVISANINVSGQKYQIRNVGDTGHVMREIDERAFGLDHLAPPAFIAKGAKPTLPGTPLGSKDGTPPIAAVNTALDDGSIIDVMVMYTTAARISQGSTAAMNSLVNLAVAETNFAYANSGVTQRVRLVYAGEVNYAEVDFATDLARLQGTSDGFMDDVHRLRDLYAADVVSLWGNYAVGCGLSNLMTNESLSFASQAFNVVDRNCATGNYSFAHELGHNMGLQHDVFDGNGGTIVTPENSAIPTSINYAHGYVDMPNRFRTVMAISAQCEAQVPRIDCVRVPYFSNPSVNFSGAATGNASAQEYKALNDTRDTTANFRMSVNLNGPGTIIFLPTTYTVSEGAGAITLSVARHAGATGAVAVRFSTSSGTATTGADFTATSGVLTWANNETGTKTITVPVLQDGALEGPEAFTVVLDMPTGGVSIGAPGGTSAAATVNIIDDDTDSFPVGCTLPLTGWANPPAGSGATAGWVLASDSFYGPACSLKSGPIADAGRAQIQFTGDFTAGNVSFARRVSSQSGVDCLRFLIDGVAQNIGGTCASGEVAWSVVSAPIAAGVHTLTWTYEKDGAGAAGADAAWIDSLVMPLGGPALIQSAPPPGGFLNIFYSHTFVSSGSPTIAYALLTPLPSGLTFDTNAGVISGIPSALGSSSVRIRAFNASLPFDQKDYVMTIIGAAPSAPIIGVATAGTNRVSIAFAPPPSEGSTPVTSYTASCNQSASPASAATSPIELTNLVNGTEYTCAVTATNLYGTSASSSPVLVTPFAVKPGAPTIGTATPGNAQAFIAFTPPAFDGGAPISGYTATCNPGALTGSATFSPVTVSGLVNNTAYTCAVTANNAVGPSVASATVAVTPSTTPMLSLTGALSRKTHGVVGAFDISINTTLAITGAITVEPRSIGSGHTVVFSFNDIINAAGSVTVVDGANAAVGATAIATGTGVTVTIPALADNTRVTVSLTGVNGDMRIFSASLGFLVGDVNGSRSVNSSDISGVKARSGQIANAANFRFDVNASGAINSSDISIVKARSGLVLP